MDELADMKRQRHSVSYTIYTLNKDVEKYSFKAEDKEDLYLKQMLFEKPSQRNRSWLKASTLPLQN